MSMQDWANFSEIVGGLVVLITLIYLAVQVRQNNIALHSATAQAIHNTFMEGFTMLCTDDELNRVYRIGILDPTQLNEDEMAKFFAFLGYFTASMHNAHYQHTTGAVDRNVTGSWLEGYQQVYQTPGFQMFWPLRKHFYSEAYRAYVEEKMSAAQPFGEYRPFTVGMHDDDAQSAQAEASDDPVSTG